MRGLVISQFQHAVQFLKKYFQHDIEKVSFHTTKPAITTSARFPWYETVESDDLEQGDIFEQCPIFTIASPFSYEDYTAPNFKAEFNSRLYDVIVMTQSCDLTKDHPKVDEVLLCAMWDLEKNRRET